MSELDKRAEAYMRSVMQNDGDVFTRSDLYEYIIEAYKQGYCDREPAKCPKRVPETLDRLILNPLLDEDTQDALKFADSFTSIFHVLKSKQDNEHI